VMSASGAEVLAKPHMREIFLGAQGPPDSEGDEQLPAESS
jgi:hypothetical protein